MNGASYSNDFTTILRVSRCANLDHDDIDPNDDGRDPLPDPLAKTVLNLSMRTPSATVDEVTEEETGSSCRPERPDAPTARLPLLWEEQKLASVNPHRFSPW
jgi:hypothetical protein